MKVIYKIGIGFIVCGIVAAGVGTFGILKNDAETIKKSQEKYDKIHELEDFSNEYDAKSIENIEIMSNSTDVSIYKSENDKIAVKATDIYKKCFSVSTQNKTFLVDLSDEEKTLDTFMNFSFGFLGSKKDSKIEVYLPAKYYNSIYIEENYGDVKVENAECGKISIDNDCGDTVLKNVEAKNNLKINSDYSDVELKSVQSYESTNIKANCGDVIIDDSKLFCLDIDSNYGDIKVDNSVISKSLNFISDSGDTEISNTKLDCNGKFKADYGDIKLNINGNKENYTTQLDVNLGDSSIDSENTKFYNGKNSKYILNVYADCGDIDVNFLE